jgi:sterol desaturase/sphingolipid hydroxylase (fatty acid hydroxylase superfamily)
MHPLEFFFGNLIPAFIPCYLFGRPMHMYTFFIWQFFRFLAIINRHSGYDFPWLPWELQLLRSPAKYIQAHYASKGDDIVNYSCQLTTLDTLLGTNKRFFESFVTEQEANLNITPSP